jgi:hypothetical protein
MKKIITLLFVLFIITKSFCQNSTIQTDHQSGFNFKNKSKLIFGPLGDKKNDFSKKFLEKKIENANNNFNDPRLHLQEVYKILKVKINTPFNIPSEYLSILNENDKRTIGNKNNNSKNEYYVYQINSLKNLIITKYNEDVNSFYKDTKQKMNINYIQSWRTIDSLYPISKKFLEKEDSVDIDSIKALNTTLESFFNSNQFVDNLKCNVFKNWIWYNEGFLLSNPMFLEDEENLYPEKEWNISSEELKNIVDLKNKNIQKTKDLLVSSQLLNKVIIPNIEDEKNNIELWNFDAANEYYIDDFETKKKNFTEDKNVIVCIHNVPKDKIVDIKTSTSSISLNNSYINALKSSVDSASSLLSLTNGIGTALSTFITSNKGESNKVKKNIEVIPTDFIPTENQADPSFKFVKLQALSNSENEPPRNFNFYEKSKNNRKKISNIIVSVGGEKFELSKNYIQDKKAIVKKLNFLNENELTSFLKEDNSKKFTYSNEKLLKEQINELQDAVIKFHNEMLANEKKLAIDELQNYYYTLAYLVTMPTRDLPIQNLKADTNETPLYRTVIQLLEMNAGNKVKLTIKEISTDKSGDTNTVFQNSIKVGKKIKLDISAGIGYTWREYENKVNKSGTLDFTNKNDRVHGVAGLHFYPCGINKMEEEFVWKSGFKNRTSIFVGFDFLKPLENLYPGVSIDIVPGFKIINGVHLYKHTKYHIENNTIIDQYSALRCAGLYTSINIDASIFSKIISTFLK